MVSFALANLTDDVFTFNAVGCAAFNKIDRNEALKYVHATTVIILQYGHVYRDGDTIGDEDGPVKLRLRHCAEAVNRFQTDTWMLFHAASVLNDVETSGERPRQSATASVDNRVRREDG